MLNHIIHICFQYCTLVICRMIHRATTRSSSLYTSPQTLTTLLSTYLPTWTLQPVSPAKHAPIIIPTVVVGESHRCLPSLASSWAGLLALRNNPNELWLFSFLLNYGLIFSDSLHIVTKWCHFGSGSLDAGVSPYSNALLKAAMLICPPDLQLEFHASFAWGHCIAGSDICQAWWSYSAPLQRPFCARHCQHGSP